MTGDSDSLEQTLVELIRQTSVELPGDVIDALRKAKQMEQTGSPAESSLTVILDNVEAAKKAETPICQDTGSPQFFVTYPPTRYTEQQLTKAIHSAIARATEDSILRPNAVDPVTGQNSGDNVGAGAPSIHFEQGDDEKLVVRLLLKGGGSENVSAQYSLPDAEIGAGRDLEGVRRCVLDAVYRAQGKGCAPGIVGVGIGGPDRASSTLLAKEQLLRRLDDTSRDDDLAGLEKRLHEELNTLGIGPMGFGGKTTVVGVKIGAAHRHPASFFVSVAYLCWAARRGRLTIDETGDASYE